MKVTIKHTKTDKVLFSFNDISSEFSILQLKKKIYAENKKLYPTRQSLRTTPTGKSLANTRRLVDLTEPEKHDQLSLYFRDLGSQISWRTVFLVEYTGPLFIYFAMWLLRQPELPNPLFTPINTHRQLRLLACLCWCGHYCKRVLETIFVHRFSHATMPLFNLFRNCGYYFGFTAFVAYYVNHPLYTLPSYGCIQICMGLTVFLVAEWGNFSCHLALKHLRPPGSTVRQIPVPLRGWFLTKLFNHVACPNYTYETLAWLGFSAMVQTLPALMFTVVGFTQMAQWGRAKLRCYRREFSEFPRNCKSIVPFVY